ncbi:MAG: class I SAM-dependent methyltransferase [Mycobacterium sp.]|jgi:SAM-dependent methyltransferase|nr:class I SAM-dependent methyltransferase [Mycobacterium sp.]
MSEPPADAGAVWEEHYRAKPQVWSGRVNTSLAQIAAQLPVGRALDLGCGEGADAIWLAEQGWTVVAVDISSTALERVRAQAAVRGVADRVDTRRHDLERGLPDDGFDLVSAQFLHSTVAMDRAGILRAAAAAVAPGGSLLIVDHASAPPWATKMAHHEFPDTETVLAGLGLDPERWQRARVGAVERAARGPDGEDVTLLDNVMWLRRMA